jgi:extracellular factor (EF) 3-hydroxypalmitic acid methyl ester biosynthesis protein
LEEFRIFTCGQPVYSGRAVVGESVNTGTLTVISVSLDDTNFDNHFFSDLRQSGRLRERFQDFLGDWQKVCKVLPEFKLAVADIQTFLLDLRRWIEQLEIGIRASPTSDRNQQERAVIDELTPNVLPAIDDLFGKFEEITAALSRDQVPLHRSYIQRHLHPIVLCAPFAYRSYRKPLGYAGDYEMVNMMLRDPREGSSMFAKVFNVWLLHQGSARAHRNRIDYLKDRLVDASAAALRAGRRARVFNLGCGPAWEIQEFLVQSQLSDSVDFTLLDFNDETLQHANRVLLERQRKHHRHGSIELVKRSVQQLLKDLSRGDGLSRGNNYDFVYCAGLFDYLPDRTCKRLMSLFYQSLNPRGLVVATNVAPTTPNRGSLELILDWNLVYRNAERVAALRPEAAPLDAMRVQSDLTGFNLFLEVQKADGF